MMKKNIKKKRIEILVFIIMIIVLISLDTIIALKNPSAVYCEKMGYKFVIEETEVGQVGICKFSETESCIAQDFLIGKCGGEYSYCNKKGYELKTISDSEKCSSIPASTECAVCVLKNGTEVEVTKLMDLSFEEGICGDGRCVLGENHNNCPQDCPSGSFDRYCDGIADGLCDPDCIAETDPDCACGDGVCINETQKSCCLDCGCPQGMRCVENECVEESIKEKVIEDKKVKSKSYYLILIPLIILIIIVVIIIYKFKKKPEAY